MCNCCKTNTAVDTRPITADHDEVVIQADTSGAAHAVGVVKRVVLSRVKQHAVTVARGIEIGGYNVSVVVDFMDGRPNRPFPGRVKRRVGCAPVGGSKRQVIPAGVDAEHGDYARVVDPPGCSQTCDTRRVQPRERRANQQKSMLYAGRVDVSAYDRTRVINPNRIRECCARDSDVGERSLGVRKPYFNAASVGAPAPCWTPGDPESSGGRGGSESESGRRMSNTVPRFRSIFWKLGKIMESVKAAAQLRYLGDRHAAQLDSPDSLYPPSE
jgi:hypothetical protein